MNINSNQTLLLTYVLDEPKNSKKSACYNKNEINDAIDFNKLGYHLLLNDLKRMESKLENYDVAIQTVKGIGILEEICANFKRETLTRDVYAKSGLSIHAAENYEKVEEFAKTVKLFGEAIKTLYAESKNDNQKLRFFTHGLNSRACFEDRFEHIFKYSTSIKNLKGLLQYEIVDLNNKKKRPPYVSVERGELIEYLKEGGFLDENHIDQDNLEFSSIWNELEQGEWIISKDKPTPLARISHALSTDYDDWGAGILRLKEFLLQRKDLTDKEKENLDKLIEEYFSLYPDRKIWI